MNISRLALILLLLTIALSPHAVLAQADLIANGGFESFDGTGIAASWVRWAEEIPNPNDGSLNYAVRPDWSPESNPTFVQAGGQSQHVGTNWNPWHAGVFQTLTTSPGARVRITAYGRIFASTPDFPNPSDTLVQARMQIGADPNGGAEWWSGSVQWSGAGNPHDTWQPFTLEVTAGASGRVTVFLSTSYKGDSRYHLDAWWDSASAVVTGSEPTPTSTTAPLPTAGPAPTSGPAPTIPPTAAPETQPAPTAELATAVPTQSTAPGSACVVLFEDSNGNGQLDGGEKLIAGGQIQIEDATKTVATHITDGVSEPKCFEGLSAGAYTVTARLPAGYFSTTGDSITVDVEPAGRAEVQIGAQSSRITQPTPAPDSGSEIDLTFWLIAGCIGIVVLLAIAAALVVVIRQR